MITNDQAQRIIALAHDFAAATADASNGTMLNLDGAKEMRTKRRVTEHLLHEFLGSITGTAPELLGYITQHSVDKLVNSGTAPGNEGLAISIRPKRKLMATCGVYFIGVKP